MAEYKPIPSLSEFKVNRFWGFVQVDMVNSDACWPWQGRRNTLGYGKFHTHGHDYAAHRVAWTLTNGAQIPGGLPLDHLCRNPPCCNPAHLEPVTTRENILRGISPIAEHAKQTHCQRGHEFTVNNTRFRRGRRECRICLLEESRESWKRTGRERDKRRSPRQRRKRV